MQQINTTKSRHCTFSFFDKDAQEALIDGKMEDHDLEFLMRELWNMQSDVLITIGMELAQA